MNEARVLYVKFDLTRQTVKGFQELSEVARRECAVRSTLGLKVHAADELWRGVERLFLNPEAEYVVIKAPTLEGTELWIISEDEQENLEQAAGFEKKSTPLLKFKPDRLRNGKARPPAFDESDSGDETEIEIGVGKNADNPGVEIVFSQNEKGDRKLSDQEIIRSLEDSGHLIGLA